MGYRFELRKLMYNPVVKKGEGLQVRGLWANTGVAPIYHKYPLVVRLKNEKEVISLTSKTDIRSWLPDMDILWEEEFALEGKAGEYSLEIGIETGIPELGNIKLAIEGLKDGYYCLGKIIVE